MSMNAKCPVCDETMTMNDDVQVNELLRCASCRSQLVFLGDKGNGPVLEQIEMQDEDWGE